MIGQDDVIARLSLAKTWLAPGERMIIVARARITCFSAFKRPLATIGKRAMSTKTIAVLDYGDLKDGQMYVSNYTAPIIRQ
jgi:hypothetical protein